MGKGGCPTFGGGYCTNIKHLIKLLFLRCRRSVLYSFDVQSCHVTDLIDPNWCQKRLAFIRCLFLSINAGSFDSVFCLFILKSREVLRACLRGIPDPGTRPGYPVYIVYLIVYLTVYLTVYLSVSSLATYYISRRPTYK